MLNKFLLLVAAFFGLFVLLPFGVYAFSVLLPEAIKIEKLANESKMQVRVVDRDTNQPIENAVVTFDASYFSYSPGVMQNVRSKSRGYWATTDKNGVASIPMKYFLIKGMRYSSRVLCFFKDVSIADLPASAKIIVKHEDYAGGKTEVGKGANKFIKFTDGAMLPEIRLRQTARVNTKRGRFGNSDRNHADGLDASKKTEVYFRIHPEKEFLTQAKDKNEADFAVKYELIKAVDFDDDPHEGLKTLTGDDKVYKLLSSIETYGKGGVAHDPKAPNNPVDLGDVSKLNYQDSLSFQNKDGSRDDRLVVVRSRDGEHFISLNIHPYEIWWVYPKGEAVFWHTGFHPGPFTKAFFVKDFREFDPTVPPDFRHWKK